MRRLACVFVLALVAVVLVPTGALAAPDHSVTVTTTGGAQTWDGAIAALGANTNYSSGAGGPCPDEPSIDGTDYCEQVLLHADIPPAFWDSNSGGVTVGIGDYTVPTSDFDLYAYQSDPSGSRGSLIDDSAAGAGAEESVTIPRASGYYLLHVVYWAVAASGYTGTAEVVTGGGGGGSELPLTEFFFHDDGDLDPGAGTFDTSFPTSTTPTVAPGSAVLGALWTGEIDAGQLTTLEVDFWQNAPVGQVLLGDVDYEVALETADGIRTDFPFFTEPAPATLEPTRVIHVFTPEDPGSPLPLQLPGGEATIEITGHFIDTQAVTEIYYDSTDFPSGFSANVPRPVTRAPFPPDVDDPPGLQESLASDPSLGFTSRSEMHIAQNPLDPDMLIAGSKFYNKDPDALAEYEFKIGTYVSFDGGVTWEDLGQLAVCPIEEAPPESWPHNTCYPEDDPNAEGPEEGGTDLGEEYITSDPWVQFDDEGDASIMVLDHPPFDGTGEGNGWGMTLHRWESVSPEDMETGDTWSDRIPINFYEDELSQELFLDDKNTFAVNNAGVDGDGATGIMIACWGQTIEPLIKQQIVCERSTDGGRSWPEAPLPISDAQHLVIGVDVVADTRDPQTFYATWGQYATGGGAGDIGGSLTPETLEFAVTTDGGQTWVHRPVPIRTFTGIPRQFPGQSFRNLTIPIMAVGPEGDLSITYAEYLRAPVPEDDEDGMQADIMLVRSTDGGLTWGDPINLTADTGPGTNPNADQFQPYVTTTEAGQLNVVYFDRRLDLRTEEHPGNYFTDVFLSRSNDGGDSWTDVRLTHDATDPELNAAVSPSGLFFGDYQGLVADDCNAIPFVNDTHLANDLVDPGPVRDPDFDDGLPDSPFQEAVSWRVPNTTAFGGTRSEPCAEPDLVVSALEGVNNQGVRQGEKVTLTATISNQGDGEAGPSSTEFVLDDSDVLGLVDTPAIPAGGSAQVSVNWDTRGVSGEHRITATADATGAVGESVETNNVGVLTVTVRGNKVENGSFEQPDDSGSGPAGWTPSETEAGRTSWSDDGSDGSKAAKITGTGGSVLLAGAPGWSSDPIEVVPGEVLELVTSVRTTGTSSPASAGLAFLGEAGQVLDTLEVLTAPLSTGGFVTLDRSVTIPAGVVEVRVILSGFAPTDTSTSGTVIFDDVGLFPG
jgi:hypothetical protein